MFCPEFLQMLKKHSNVIISTVKTSIILLYAYCFPATEIADIFLFRDSFNCKNILYQKLHRGYPFLYAYVSSHPYHTKMETPCQVDFSCTYVKCKCSTIQATDDSHPAPARCDQEVSVDIFLSKLLCNIQTQRTIVVIDVTFCQITQNTVRTIHFFKLQRNHAKNIIINASLNKQHRTNKRISDYLKQV